MKYTDAHCHILGRGLDNSAVVGRIVNATCEDEWGTIIKIVDAGCGVFGAIGIHPWKISDVMIGWDGRLVETLKMNPCVMVGEIGMDKFRPNIEKQQDFFIRQFEIATEFGRVVNLHCVGAWERILHVLKSHTGAMPPAIIAHGFNGDADIISGVAEKYNMFFSFSTRNIDLSNEKKCNRIRAVPADRLLVESDVDNILDEVPNIMESVEKIAKIIGQGKDETLNQIYKNFQGVIKYVG